MPLHEILAIIAAIVLAAIVIIICEVILPVAIDILGLWILRIVDIFRRDDNDKS